MCQILSGNAAGKVRDIFEKNESLRLIVQAKLKLVRSYDFLVESLFNRPIMQLNSRRLRVKYHILGKF
jgi:hypothetical protein